MRLLYRVLLPVAMLLVDMPAGAAEHESADAIRADVSFLADDLLEGRKPGTRAYDIAALYVASRLRAAGWLAAGDRGGWFQEVRLQERTLAEHDTVLTVSNPEGTTAWRHGTDAIFFTNPSYSDHQVEAAAVFAGFGLDAPDQGFDDYAGLDVQGKIVVVLTGVPSGRSGEIGAHLAARKAEMAEDRGAVGLVAITTLRDGKLYPWSRQLENGTMPRMSWIGADGRPATSTPDLAASIYVSPAAATALFTGSRRSLETILEEADRGAGRPEGFPLPAKIRLEWRAQDRVFSSPNVVGLLPGHDPDLRDETVLMIAHLDHVGRRPAKDGDSVINGAIDNAAGVAVMLEVARSIQDGSERPRRSILFLAPTAEESGLLGTEYFADNPPVSLERIVGVVNLDVPVLTYDFIDVIAFGAERSTLGETAGAAAAAGDARLSPDPVPAESLFTRSDHYVLVKKGVPSIFLTTGRGGSGDKAWQTYLRHRYHQPSDDLSQPFDWGAAARFARITRQLVLQIANDPVRPRWYEDDFFGNAFAPDAQKAIASQQ